MDEKTYEELMEIQSALNGLPTSELLSRTTDDPEITKKQTNFQDAIKLLKVWKVIHINKRFTKT